MRIGIIFSTIALTLILCLIYSGGFVASVLAAKSQQSIKEGDGLSALGYIQAAERLSPLVSTYPKVEAQYLHAWYLQDSRVRPTLEPMISLKLRRAIDLNPLYFRHYITASNILYSLEHFDQSVRMHEIAIVLVPNSTRLRNQLALKYLRVGDIESARAQLEIAIALVEDGTWSFESYYIAAQLYQDSGKDNMAIASLVTSLKRAPNSPICHIIIAQLRSALDNLDNIYPNQKECSRLVKIETELGSNVP